MKLTFIVKRCKTNTVLLNIYETKIRHLVPLEGLLFSSCGNWTPILFFSFLKCKWFHSWYEWHFSDSLDGWLKQYMYKVISLTYYVLDTPQVLIFTGNVQFYLSGFGVIFKADTRQVKWTPSSNRVKQRPVAIEFLNMLTALHEHTDPGTGLTIIKLEQLETS